MTAPGQATPPFVRLAAHPLRWRLMTELATSDYRVRELTERVGQPQNLVSYHLRLLRGGGLVTARRSSFDARDSYYHLDLDRCADALTTTGTDLHPALHPAPPSGLPPSAPSAPLRGRPRVLFVCTGNSARYPLAKAVVDDLDAEIDRLRGAGLPFRSDPVSGPGGRQILLADPVGNLAGLFRPAQRP